MEVESKEAGVQGGASFPLATDTAPATDEEIAQILVAAAETGQLPHEIWGRGYLWIH